MDFYFLELVTQVIVKRACLRPTETLVNVTYVHGDQVFMERGGRPDTNGAPIFL